MKVEYNGHERPCRMKKLIERRDNNNEGYGRKGGTVEELK